MAQCPDCGGSGTETVSHKYFGERKVPCLLCRGKREVEDERLARVLNGRRLRSERLEKGQTLEQAAAEANMGLYDYIMAELGGGVLYGN